MKRFIILLSVLFIGIVAGAQQNKALLDSAEVYYSKNNFEEAINIYESLLADGYYSADLYYNLGNAYYKSNRYPMAIVNYERALKLSPTDTDVEFNLKMANIHVVDEIEIVPEFFLNTWRGKFNQMYDSNTWALISLIVFVASLLLLLGFFFSNQTIIRKVTFWLSVVFMILFLVSFSTSRKTKILAEKEPEAIVITPSVVVQSAPNASGTELFIIHEGLKIKVVSQLDDWSRIRLSDGNKGWLKTADLVVI